MDSCSFPYRPTNYGEKGINLKVEHKLFEAYDQQRNLFPSKIYLLVLNLIAEVSIGIRTPASRARISRSSFAPKTIICVGVLVPFNTPVLKFILQLVGEGVVNKIVNTIRIHHRHNVPVDFLQKLSVRWNFDKLLDNVSCRGW